METAGELCVRDVVIVDRDASIREAAVLMRQHHVGDLVVVETRENRNVPVGILTDRDIAIELVAEGVELDRISVGDAMSFRLLTVEQDTSIYDSLEQMRERAVRRCPVVDAKGGLIGILSADDLLEFFTEELEALISLVHREQARERKTRTRT
ncbi:MAG: CBS domain-containing protein [Gammaproteobacteria bacterium]|nr:CBS domain-containing protein [Gammaproteobacteria bacterium]